jgi:hypothetical protein
MIKLHDMYESCWKMEGVGGKEGVRESDGMDW